MDLLIFSDFVTLLLNSFITQTQNIKRFSNNTGVWDHSLSTLWPMYTMIHATLKPTASERKPSLVSSMALLYFESSMPWTVVNQTFLSQSSAGRWTRWDWWNCGRGRGPRRRCAPGRSAATSRSHSGAPPSLSSQTWQTVNSLLVVTCLLMLLFYPIIFDQDLYYPITEISRIPLLWLDSLNRCFATLNTGTRHWIPKKNVKFCVSVFEH